MQKIPLSIVCAVLNEEKNLPSFLDHATKLADEVIIIVDYRTKDDSAAIAKKYGCTVLFDKGESKGIVFYNKNKGIDQAKNDWVLILDADERMDEILQKEVADIVTGVHKTEASTFQTGFINFEFGKYFDKSDQSNKKFVRLFKKGAFKYETKETAEGFNIQTNSLVSPNKNKLINIKTWPFLRTYFLSKNPDVDNLKGLLIHNSHPSISDFVRKINLYSSREAKIYLENNTPGSLRILWMLFIIPPSQFLYKYFVWRFYREGIHGVIASGIYAIYSFLIAAKIYSYQYKRSHQKSIKDSEEKYNFTNQADED